MGTARSALVAIGARLGALSVGIALVLAWWATPASAHSLSGAQASNYQTTISKLTPAVAGVTFRVIDLGSRLELRNDSHHVVEVLGYEQEPYLRVERRTVQRNQRSPATFLNQTQLLPGPVPTSFDAHARPVWHTIGSSGVVRWHDHRTHWMATSPPPIVTSDPGSRHVLIPHWKVPLLIDGKPATLTGNVVWVPGPSPVPWVALALLVAGFLFAVTWTVLARPVTKIGLVIGAVSAIAIAIGGWQYSTASFAGHLGVVVYQIAAAALAAVAFVRLQRSRSLYAVGPLLLIAGMVLALGAGLANVTDLFRSQLPTTLPPGLERLVVGLSLGVGVGLAAVGARNLAHPQRRSTVARSARRPAGSTDHGRAVVPR